MKLKELKNDLISNEEIKYVTIPFEYDYKVISKTTDARIYKNAVLLTPGVWSDVITNSPVIYDDSVLRKYATNWTSNYLNIDHSDNPLDRIGIVQSPYYKDSKVCGDLHIYPITSRAKDTIALIDAGLVNNLSVEIKTVDRWDSKEMSRRVEKITFVGCAVVVNPACVDTRIK